MKKYSVEEIKRFIETGNKKRFYDSYYWRYVISPAIRARDNNECQHCKREGKVKTSHTHKLDINHIKPLEDYPKLAYEFDNLELICVHHHNIADKKYLLNKQLNKKPLNEEKW